MKIFKYCDMSSVVDKLITNVCKMIRMERLEARRTSRAYRNNLKTWPGETAVGLEREEGCRKIRPQAQDFRVRLYHLLKVVWRKEGASQAERAHFIFIFETGGCLTILPRLISYSWTQAILLPPPPQSVRTIDMSHRAWPEHTLNSWMIPLGQWFITMKDRCKRLGNWATMYLKKIFLWSIASSFLFVHLFCLVLLRYIVVMQTDHGEIL